MKRLNGLTAALLSVALLLSCVNSALVFFVHIPLNGRLRPRTYFQAYGLAELALATLGLVLTTIVIILLYRRSEHDGRGAGPAAWGFSITALALGLLDLPHYIFLVGILLIGACLSLSARQSRVTRTGY